MKNADNDEIETARKEPLISSPALSPQTPAPTVYIDAIAVNQHWKTAHLGENRDIGMHYSLKPYLHDDKIRVCKDGYARINSRSWNTNGAVLVRAKLDLPHVERRARNQFPNQLREEEVQKYRLHCGSVREWVDQAKIFTDTYGGLVQFLRGKEGTVYFVDPRLVAVEYYTELALPADVDDLLARARSAITKRWPDFRHHLDRDHTKRSREDGMKWAIPARLIPGATGRQKIILKLYVKNDRLRLEIRYEGFALTAPEGPMTDDQALAAMKRSLNDKLLLLGGYAETWLAELVTVLKYAPPRIDVVSLRRHIKREFGVRDADSKQMDEMLKMVDEIGCWIPCKVKNRKRRPGRSIERKLSHPAHGIFDKTDLDPTRKVGPKAFLLRDDWPSRSMSRWLRAVDAGVGSVEPQSKDSTVRSALPLRQTEETPREQPLVPGPKCDLRAQDDIMTLARCHRCLGPLLPRPSSSIIVGPQGHLALAFAQGSQDPLRPDRST